MRADDIRRRNVHEIPVVDAIGASKIQPVDPLLCRHVGPAVRVREQDHREQPHFVPARVEQLLDFGEREIAELARHCSDLRDREAEEAVSLAVLSGSRLEESQRVDRALRIAHRSHATHYACRCLTHDQTWLPLSVFGTSRPKFEQ